MSELVRQFVIAAVFEVTSRGPYNTPGALKAWDALRWHASLAEIYEITRRWSNELVGAIHAMARADADTLGLTNEPRFEDAVEVWTECDDTDGTLLQALRLMHPHGPAEEIYRGEWERIRALAG